MELKHAYRLIGTMIDMPEREVIDFARFVREAGLIPTGRPGPGGGTPDATAKALANLLVGILASESKRDAGIESNICGSLPRLKRQPRISKGAGFAHALTHVLAHPELAQTVSRVTVARKKWRASIVYDDGSVEWFGALSSPTRDEDTFWIEAALNGGVIHQLATDLAGREDGDWTS